ncbi:MAG TPA: ABC transporter permease subunit [Gemmataceae bacterium]|nr:ABC transporter permease subunit [Gemmataceae bacterium]
MKYLAILKDSLRETIDSKVLFVVIAISVLAIFPMATLSLTPNSPDDALQKITDRFPDGSQEVDLPILGKIKATPSFTEYSVQDLSGPEDGAKPWESEYHFVIQTKDVSPMGARIAILNYLMKTEDTQERLAQSGKKTRAQQIGEEIAEEARRIQEREEKKGRNRFETQRQIQEQLIAYVIKRLENEARSLKPAEMEQFIKAQLEDQGNWRVLEVQELQLPAAERTVKLKVRVPVQEGGDVRIKTEDAEGEVHRFAVKVVSRDGTYRVWPHKATLLFGAIPLGNAVKPGELVYKISHYIVGIFGSAAIMLLSCVITAFFIPNMLRKGTVDLLLAKPINRVSLLAYKYVGGLTFILINTTVLIGGLWLALGARSGIWDPAFLYMILVLTFEFALFYALSTLAAVLTRSPIVSILVCVVAWGLLWGLGWAYWFTGCRPETKEAFKGTVATAVNVTHAVAPHYLDLDWLGDKTIMEHSLSLSEGERAKLEADGYNQIRWSESLAVTSIYIVLLLGLACWRFAVKDY